MSRPPVPTIASILGNIDQWRRKAPSSSLSTTRKYALLKKFDRMYIGMYPWLVEVKEDKEVVGLLCKVCRENFGTDASNMQLKKSGGKWVTVPFVKFGDLMEEAKKHEFGSGIIKVHQNEDPRVLRQKVLSGAISGTTTHLKFVLKRQALQQGMSTGKTIDNTIKRISISQAQQNATALQQLCSLVHRAIKKRQSPFATVKDAALFSMQILKVESLKPLFYKHAGEKGISYRRISEIVEAIYDLNTLGICIELTTGRVESEVIIFGGVIDCGSKCKKTKEYAGVGIKYLILDEESPTIMSRAIGFKRTVYKDGKALTDILVKSFKEFSDRMEKLQSRLQHLFPLKFIPKLKMENMESLGVDGACISKDKMVNKRILKYNPRSITNWCGSHKSALVSNDVLKASHRHEEAHNIREKLFDLVNASPKFEDLFKESQLQTFESKVFKGGQPVVMSDRPMHRWESTLKFDLKLERLLLSTENFLSEIESRGWAKDAKQKKIYPANFLMKKFPTDEFLVTMAVETDVLEILIHFVKNTEFADQDMSLFMEQVEDVSLELEGLSTSPGTHSRNIVTRLLTGDLKEWHNNDVDEETMKEWHCESIDLFLLFWKERFGECGVLDMFKYFSISLFRKTVASIEDAQNFGKIFETKLANYYCEPKSFVATYPEDKGKVFTCDAIGSRYQFERDCRFYKRYLYRNFMDKNPGTGKPWKTSEVLLKLLSSNSEEVWSWLGPELRYIMSSCLVQVMSSADVERVMSTFNLYDNKLNQAAKDHTVEQMVLLMKEAPSWRSFDAQTAELIWRLQKPTRKLAYPPITIEKLTPSEGTSWVKPAAEIKSGAATRKQRLIRRLQLVHSLEEEDGDLEEESGNESEESDEESDEKSDEESCNESGGESSHESGSADHNNVFDATNVGSSRGKDREEVDHEEDDIKKNEDDAIEHKEEESEEIIESDQIQLENKDGEKKEILLKDICQGGVAKKMSVLQQTQSLGHGKKKKVIGEKRKMSNCNTKNESSKPVLIKTVKKDFFSAIAAKKQKLEKQKKQSIAEKEVPSHKNKENEEIIASSCKENEHEKQQIIKGHSITNEIEQNEANTHFNIESGKTLFGQSPVGSIDSLQEDMWVLVHYEGKVYVGEVISIHQNVPKLGDSAKIRCLEREYGDMDLETPQDFEPQINWVLHSVKNLYVCPVRVRKVLRNRKTLWIYHMDRQ